MSAPLSADVLVVGAGAAGAIAALAAREAGASVIAARRAWGATALSSGAADVAPDPLSSPGSPLGGRASVEACARSLALRRPEHPYAMLRERLGALGEALRFASRATGGLLAFGDPGEENRVLLSPFGALKQSAGGLRSILDGDLLRVRGTVGVVGFDRPGLELDARDLAAAAEETCSLAGLRLRAVPIECDLLRWSDLPLLRRHEVAERIEADPEALATSILRALPAEPFALLLLPPVIARGDPEPVLRILEERLGVRCAELPAGARSVPGLRLQEGLERRLSEAGVRLVEGEVFLEGGDDAPSLVERPRRDWADRLRLSSSREARGDAEAVVVRACVLAAGKFIGGGVERHGRMREPIFDLPVWVEGAVDEGRWVGDSTRPAWLERQAAMAAGLRVDGSLRPLLRDGAPFDDRVFACGAILAGNDPAADGAGIGLAVFSGYLAGREAAARARASERGAFGTAAEAADAGAGAP
ncbi:MAG TPA: FAD-binding protein [Vulgatibacter sp.]|nr:FAD-binding protein [Vulgatibacter sp.]